MCQRSEIEVRAAGIFIALPMKICRHADDKVIGALTIPYFFQHKFWFATAIYLFCQFQSESVEVTFVRLTLMNAY